MGYTYEGPGREKNRPLLDEIDAIAPEQPAKPRRRLTRFQWFLLASTAGLVLALVIILVTGVLP